MKDMMFPSFKCALCLEQKQNSKVFRSLRMFLIHLRIKHPITYEYTLRKLSVLDYQILRILSKRPLPLYHVLRLFLEHHPNSVRRRVHKLANNKFIDMKGSVRLPLLCITDAGKSALHTLKNLMVFNHVDMPNMQKEKSKEL